MTGASDWTLSDDRRTLTLHFPESGGTRTVVLGWAQPVTDALLMQALTSQLLTRTRLKAGQRNTTRVFRVLGGSLYVHCMAGPPTWWAPRCFRSADRSLVAGWLRRGWAVRWKRGWVSQGDDAPEAAS